MEPDLLLSEDHRTSLIELLNTEAALNGPVLKTSIYLFGVFSKNRLDDSPLIKVLPMRTSCREFSIYDDISVMHDELIWELNDRLDTVVVNSKLFFLYHTISND